MARRLPLALFVLSELFAAFEIAVLAKGCSGPTSAGLTCTLGCTNESLLLLFEVVGLGTLVLAVLWSVARHPPLLPWQETGANVVYVFGVGYLLAFRFFLIYALARWDLPGCSFLG